MVRHSSNASELWKSIKWKKFQKILFRLQRRLYKAITVGNQRKARGLQKLILKSQSARLLAVRQVTQLNAGKKTAGVDGKASLTFEERLTLSNELRKNVNTWKHQKLREIPIPKKDGSIRMLKVPTMADDESKILERINVFLAERGMKTSERKTKVTATKDGFDFLGWHFRVQKNGKFRSIPSVDNFKAFHKKIKNIVNNSNYGARVKAEKLAPIVRGWRNYHRFCRMDGSRYSLYFLEDRTYRVFNKETKLNRYSSKTLLDQAFPAVSFSENRHINVKGNKSPYDGDIPYWSERNSKLYDGYTSKALKRQNHKCIKCGLKFIGEERIHLHHVDGNHSNWRHNNLIAIHESCHDYIHMENKSKAIA